MAASRLTPRYDAHQPRTSLQTEMVTSAQCSLLVCFATRAKQGLTINNATILYDFMPADCLVKAVKRNLDDTEAEILYDKQQPEDSDFPRVVLKDNSAAKS